MGRRVGTLWAATVLFVCGLAACSGLYAEPATKVGGDAAVPAPDASAIFNPPEAQNMPTLIEDQPGADGPALTAPVVEGTPPKNTDAVGSLLPDSGTGAPGNGFEKVFSGEYVPYVLPLALGTFTYYATYHTPKQAQQIVASPEFCTGAGVAAVLAPTALLYVRRRVGASRDRASDQSHKH